MLRFIVHRLLSSIPVLFGIVVLVFILARVIPGDPCKAQLGERATEARRATSSTRTRGPRRADRRSSSGYYLGDLLHGDLGDSVSQRRPVIEHPDRAPADHDRAVGAGTDVRHRRRRPARRDRRLPAQLGRRRRHDGRSPTSACRCRCSCSACMLQYVFAVTLKDTFFALPPSGRLSPGSMPPPFYETWGLSRQRRSRVHLQLRAPQRRAAVELGHRRRRHPAPDPAGARRRHDPAGDHRPDDPLERARRARARLRAHGPGQGLPRVGGGARATRCAARCCPSSR